MSSPTPQDFEKASQIWCQPKHSKKEFDSELAQSFAQALADEREKQDIEHATEMSFKDGELNGKDFKIQYLESEKSLLEKRMRELECQITLPNHWRCPKCKFYQVNSILAPEGVFADKRTPENCPNDGTEMMPVTWKENANDNYEGACKQAERATKAETENSRLRVENERLKAKLADKKGNLIQEREGWDRLEDLSDKVRKGVPVSMREALEVIDYQSRKKSWFEELKDWCNLWIRH